MFNEGYSQETNILCFSPVYGDDLSILLAQLYITD